MARDDASGLKKKEVECMCLLFGQIPNQTSKLKNLNEYL